MEADDGRLKSTMAHCSPFRPNVCVCVRLQDEKQRIEALGGCVIWFGTWRVNGSLSVSRAIGNHELRHITQYM